MKKLLFWNLLILVFGIFNMAFQSANQPVNTVNSANNSTQNTKPPTSSAGGAVSENTAANTKSANSDANKSGSKDSSTEDSKDKVEKRCGWFSNPTPANAWLDDKDGTWIISVQGGYEAKGDLPDIPDDQWVKTNVGSYGYGCACMKVTVDFKARRILKIVEATAKPLSACRKDPALKEPKD